MLLCDTVSAPMDRPDTSLMLSGWGLSVSAGPISAVRLLVLLSAPPVRRSPRPLLADRYSSSMPSRGSTSMVVVRMDSRPIAVGR